MAGEALMQDTAGAVMELVMRMATTMATGMATTKAYITVLGTMATMAIITATTIAPLITTGQEETA